MDRRQSLPTWLVILPVLLLGAFPATAERQLPITSTNEQGSPALFKVSDDDSHFFLFGTAHILPPNLRWHRNYVISAFDSSTVLVLENDGRALSREEVQVELRRNMFPQGLNLRHKLDPTTRSRLEAVARNYRLNPRGLDRFRPSFAAMMLSMLVARQQGFYEEHGVEAVLVQWAARRAIDQEGLEDISATTDAIGDFDEPTQLEMLHATLEEIENGDQGRTLDSMMRAWYFGDLATLEAITINEFEGVDPAISEAMLDNRNIAWLGPLHEYLDNDTVAFVAVGAAHLVGVNSLPNLLEDDGYVVERIDPQGETHASRQAIDEGS
ncbi:MAG: TraB/GumN family protein [Pseudomonadota bacterium]